MTGRRCGLCGADLAGRRADARYCSPACRRKAHRLGRSRAAPDSAATVRYGASPAPSRPSTTHHMPTEPTATVRARSYLAASDAARIAAAARREGLSFSAFMRRAALAELERQARERHDARAQAATEREAPRG